MSSGTLTQLIASGGDGRCSASSESSGPYVMSTGSTSAPTSVSASPITFVCINDICLINDTSLYGNMPSFGSLEECKKVCGVKESTLRPQ